MTEEDFLVDFVRRLWRAAGPIERACVVLFATCWVAALVLAVAH